MRERRCVMVAGFARSGTSWLAKSLTFGGRLVIAYEWLCGDPVPRFHDLYHRLDLHWSVGAERFLGAADTEGDPGTYSMRRPTARQIDKWKQRLGREDIEACRRFRGPRRQLRRRPRGVTA